MDPWHGSTDVVYTAGMVGSGTRVVGYGVGYGVVGSGVWGMGSGEWLYLTVFDCI